MFSCILTIDIDITACSCCCKINKMAGDSVSFCATCGDTLCRFCDDLHRELNPDHPVSAIMDTTVHMVLINKKDEDPEMFFICDPNFPSRIIKHRSLTTAELGVGGRIPATCLTPKGQIVLCDNWNGRVVVFNEQFHVESEHPVYNPCGLCCEEWNGFNKIFVASNSSCSPVVEVLAQNENSLVQCGKIDTHDYVYSVRRSSKRLITGHVNKVVFHPATGRPNQDTQVWQTRSCVPCIAVSPHGDKVYYSDGNCVICRGLPSGKILWTHQNPFLRGPYGICTNSVGDVYLVGKSSHNIIQISRDGQRSHVLVTDTTEDGISEPEDIVVLHDNKTLMITSGFGQTAVALYTFIA